MKRKKIKPSWRKALDLDRLSLSDRVLFLVLDKQFSREPVAILARALGSLRRLAAGVRRG